MVLINNIFINSAALFMPRQKRGEKKRKDNMQCAGWKRWGSYGSPYEYDKGG